MSVARDISERKLAEARLRASEEKYRGIFDESVAAIYVFDNEKHFNDSNQTGLDLLGYGRDELLAMSIPDVDADSVAVLAAHRQLRDGGRLVNYEHSLRRKDSSIVTVLNNSRPLTDPLGKVTGMQGTLIDVTERKRLEWQLQDAYQVLKGERGFLKTLVQTIPDLVWLKDAEGVYLACNPESERFFGHSGCAGRNKKEFCAGTLRGRGSRDRNRGRQIAETVRGI